MPIPDPEDREWLEHSAKSIEEFIGGIVGIIIAERDAEIAHLRRDIKYLESRLAAEQHNSVKEALA